MAHPRILVRFSATLNRLRTCERAVAAVEFAIVAPLFLLATLGIFDLAYQFYAKSVLTGAVNEAGRDSTLEGAASDQTAIDAKVTSLVQSVNREATVTFTRKNYRDPSLVGREEPYVDASGNGVRDLGECFEDENGNGTWDADAGADGNGQSHSTVLYTATMTFPRIFPLWALAGQPTNSTIVAKTVLRNQPYGNPGGAGAVLCT